MFLQSATTCVASSLIRMSGSRMLLRIYTGQSVHMHRKKGPLAPMTVTDLGGGVGLIDCVECGGDGDWSKYHPEPELLTPSEMACVNCKGTGKRHISFWPQ